MDWKSQRNTSPPQHNPVEGGIIDPRMGYNPSSWRQRIPICIIALIAAGISVYLALFQWLVIDNIWDPFFGDSSEIVISSDVSHKMYRYFAIPDAAMGALAYLGDAVFGLAGSVRRWQYRPWLVILFGLDVIPLGIVSIILVILQGTIVGYWCSLCIVTAIISLILVILAYDEVWLSILYLRFVYKNNPEKFWKVFWGKRPSLDLEQSFVEYRKASNVVSN